ncbi:MAG: hypothetical protein ICV53_17350 [Flavisolibacter sp.]|nr:hypothetical protein [Flavisolibacter sp.]
MLVSEKYSAPASPHSTSKDATAAAIETIKTSQIYLCAGPAKWAEPSFCLEFSLLLSFFSRKRKKKTEQKNDRDKKRMLNQDQYESKGKQVLHNNYGVFTFAPT